MPCSYSDTIPRPGDNLTVLLRKWLQSVGAPAGCFDDGEWMLLAQLVTHYGGTPRWGDSIPDLWRKILRALGDDSCHCGDWAFNIVQRILEILSPGAFRAGDSFNNLVRKILEGVNGGAVPPPPPPPVVPCCVPIGDYDSILNPVTVSCDWGSVAEIAECSDNWGEV